MELYGRLWTIGDSRLVLSVTYDWGFLSALGISMADAPPPSRTTLVVGWSGHRDTS